MDLELQGRPVLVTAATRGLGRACAEALAGEGARVAVAGRRVDVLERVVAELGERGGEVRPVLLDLADPDGPARAIDEVVGAWGGLDAVVVSGPGPRSGPALELTDSDWATALDDVFMASARVIRESARYMAGHGGGRITLISTIGIRTVQRDMALSNATRLALMGLVKNLALELAPHGVLVNQVAPGPINTDRMTELVDQLATREGLSQDDAYDRWVADVPMARMGDAGDVGSLVAFLSSPRLGFTTGAVFPVDGGKSAAY